MQNTSIISYSEYYNMSPYYTNADSNYPNVENITKTTGNYTLWLYCKSSDCGNSNGYWWAMGSRSFASASYVRNARIVRGVGNLSYNASEGACGVRPSLLSSNRMIIKRN